VEPIDQFMRSISLQVGRIGQFMEDGNRKELSTGEERALLSKKLRGGGGLQWGQDQGKNKQHPTHPNPPPPPKNIVKKTKHTPNPTREGKGGG